MADPINRRSNPPSIRVEDTSLWKEINVMREKFKLMAQKEFISIAIEGPPGLGKTWTAGEILNQGKNKLMPVAAHAPNLLDVLHRTRHDHYTLLWDDTNFVFNSGPVLNILNIAINPRGIRMMPDNRKEGHGNFVVHSRHCFLTNKRLLSDPDLLDFDRNMREQIRPLKSRFHLTHILPHDPLGCFHYACWLATDGKHLLHQLQTKDKHAPRSLGVEAANELLDWFAQNFAYLDEVSPRALMKFAEYRLKAPAIWESLCQTSINKEPRTEMVLEGQGSNAKPVLRPVKAPPAWTIRVVPVNERRVLGATLDKVKTGEIGDFNPKHSASAESHLVRIFREECSIPATITDYVIYRALWENDIYSLAEEDREDALRKALNMPARKKTPPVAKKAVAKKQGAKKAAPRKAAPRKAAAKKAAPRKAPAKKQGAQGKQGSQGRQGGQQGGQRKQGSN